MFQRTSGKVTMKKARQRRLAHACVKRYLRHGYWIVKIPVHEVEGAAERFRIRPPLRMESFRKAEQQFISSAGDQRFRSLFLAVEQFQQRTDPRFKFRRVCGFQVAHSDQIE